MEGSRQVLGLILILCMMMTTTTPVVYCQYYSQSMPYVSSQEKITHLHFFFHDTHSGKNPSAVLVARPNATKDDKSFFPFGSIFAIDDPLTAGPELKSEVIGKAQGLYVLSSQDIPSLVVFIDFGFTTGEFNGSSISVFSRNPIAQTERELAVVGGRGKFRMARGFAQLKTYFLNATTDDAIVEYNVTVIHYN